MLKYKTLVLFKLNFGIMNRELVTRSIYNISCSHLSLFFSIILPVNWKQLDQLLKDSFLIYNILCQITDNKNENVMSFIVLEN